MRTLSFDTSTGAVHLCLLEKGAVVYEKVIEPAGPQRQEVGSLLMVEIDAAFASCGWDKRRLQMVIAGVGPGSFTGIRVSVVTARTLADVLRLPLLGVSLLETYFYAASAGQDAGTRLGIVVSTTSNQFFFGGFERTADEPARAAVAAGYGGIDAVYTHLAGLPLLADDKACSLIEARPLPFLKNIAATQAALAHDRLSLKKLLPEDFDGKVELAETFPWQAVFPLYLRSPSVTLKTNHAAANPQNDRG